MSCCLYPLNIECFEPKADLKSYGEKEDVILKDIYMEYHKLTKEYEVHLRKLKDKIQEIQKDKSIENKQRSDLPCSTPLLCNINAQL